MHTTCFDQYWTSSDVFEIFDETAMLPSISSVFGYVPVCLMVMGISKTAYDTIRGTTRHHRTRGCIDEGISQKFNLQMEAQQFHQQF
jgi:hypothetical protein